MPFTSVNAQGSRMTEAISMGLFVAVRIKAPIISRPRNRLGISALMRENIDHVTWPFSQWILNEINGISCRARLLAAVRKHHRKNAIPHTRLALAIYLVCESRWQTGRAVVNRDHIFNSNPPFGGVIFGIDPPIIEIWSFRRDVDSVNAFPARQCDLAGIIPQLILSAWRNLIEGHANEIWQHSISRHFNLLNYAG